MENKPKRHSECYIETLVFEVENILFRIPSRYLFEHSEVLKAASQISANSSEGHTDESPIKLSLPGDADAEDFASFCKVIYPLTVGLPAPNDFSQKHWISVLKLATCWMFEDLRKLAIMSISETSFPFIDRVTLGRKYQVKDWVLEGLEGLSDPSNDFPFDELARLGSETAMRTLYIQRVTSKMKCQLDREEARLDCSIRWNREYCDNCSELVDLHLEKKIATVENMFREELALMTD